MVWQCLAAFMLCNLPFYMFVPSQDMEDMFSHSGSLPLNILGLGRRVDPCPLDLPKSTHVPPSFSSFASLYVLPAVSGRDSWSLVNNGCWGWKWKTWGSITLPKWSKWGEQCSFLRILRVNIPCSADFEKNKHVVSCCFICFPNETEHNMCFAGIDDWAERLPGACSLVICGTAWPSTWQGGTGLCIFFWIAMIMPVQDVFHKHQTSISSMIINEHQWSSMISGWHVQSFTKPLFYLMESPEKGEY